MLSEEQEHTYEKAMDQALRFLAPRFLSSYELRQKMIRKGIPSKLIDQVEAKLIEYDYINDDRLAEQVANLYKRECKRGLFYIKNKMRLRGLEPGQHLDDYDERQAAFRVIERKYGLDQKPPVGQEKIISILRNRGFGMNSIRAVIDELYSWHKRG